MFEIGVNQNDSFVDALPLVRSQASETFSSPDPEKSNFGELSVNNATVD